MLLIMVEELLEHIIFAVKSGDRAGLLLSKSARMSRQVKRAAQTKEVIKEQPSSRNLSATAARVLQCTCPVAASRKDRSAIVKLYC
jgi:hypothetical protein